MTAISVHYPAVNGTTIVGLHIIYLYKYIVENCINLHIVKIVINKTVLYRVESDVHMRSLSGDVLYHKTFDLIWLEMELFHWNKNLMVKIGMQDMQVDYSDKKQ